MSPSKNIIVILGPTGSGKTDLSIALARRLGAPILSADSRQVYRGMAIGTAQPDAQQLAAAEHHMIANHDITESYTCGHYEREALEILSELYRKHDTVVAVGGSGLYINALCHGMDELPEASPQLRAELEVRWCSGEKEGLLEQLRELDPDYFNIVDKANPQRVIRAIEVCMIAGVPYSSLRSGNKRRRDFRILKIGIDRPRKELYQRIDRRADMMMEAGLEAEARALYLHRTLNSLQTVGYRELFDYFDGKITRQEAVELIKRNSRRYAKRQMTWFLRDGEIRWFSPEDTGAMDSYIDDFLK